MKECQLSLLKYEVDKMEFDLNPHYRRDPEQKITIEPKLGVKILEAENEKEIKRVTVSCFIFEDAQKNNFPFSCSAQVSGTFRVNNISDEKKAEHLLVYNATAVILPYLRSVISNLTCLAEVQPVRIPIINVYDLLKEEQTQDPA